MYKSIFYLLLLVSAAFAQTTGTATGRIGAATRGGFSDVGTAQPNHLLVFRLQW